MSVHWQERPRLEGSNSSTHSNGAYYTGSSSHAHLRAGSFRLHPLLLRFCLCCRRSLDHAGLGAQGPSLGGLNLSAGTRALQHQAKPSEQHRIVIRTMISSHAPECHQSVTRAFIREVRGSRTLNIAKHTLAEAQRGYKCAPHRGVASAPRPPTSTHPAVHWAPTWKGSTNHTVPSPRS